jgi:hypothetical protein
MLGDNEMAKLPLMKALAYGRQHPTCLGTRTERISMGRAASAVAAGAMAIFLSGCETTGQTVAPKAASVAPPTSSLHGSGPSISPSYMSNYCRGELATRNVTTPASVQTTSPVREKDGSTTVDGTVNKGAEGGEAFKCRFDPNGAFVDVISMGSNGIA